MSHIVVYLDSKALEPNVLTDLQKATKKRPAELQQLIESEAPIVELELFDDDYEEHVKMLKRLVKVLTTHKLKNRIYELPEGETMKSCTFVDKCKITPKVLSNIIA